MAGNIYSGKAMVFQFQEAAAWGTAIADSAAANELSSEAVIFTPDYKVRTPDRFRGQNWPDVVDLINDNKGSMPMAVISTQCFPTEIDHFLYALVQNVSEAVDPFQKTFTFASPGPDFTNNAGYFMTLWGKAPESSLSEKIDNAIAEKLEFTLSPEANDGNLAVSATMKGIGYSDTADPSGTLTKATQTGYNFHDIAACTLDGTSIMPQEIKITLENTIVPEGYDSTTKGAETFHLANRIAKAEIKGVWNAAMRAGKTKFSSGAEIVFILNWGATGVDGFLSFNIRGVVEEANIAEDETRAINLTINGASDLANTEAMATIDVANAVNRSW